MTVINKTIKIEANGAGIFDITPRVKELFEETSVKNGSILIFTKHTTTALRINENEERLMDDIRLHMEKVAPKNAKYLHDDIELRDCPPNERINGHSHIKAQSLNTSETIPIIDGKLALGRWQAVLFFELDGKRNREVFVQISGE